MFIYTIIISTFFLYSVMEVNIRFTNTGKWCVCAFFLLLLILQDGLRWETGTDWQNYLSHFSSIQGVDDQRYGLFEVGYTSVVLLFRSLVNSYTFFLVAHAVFIYTLYFCWIKRYAAFPFITTYLFYCYTIALMGMNRQHLALAICLYSVRYIISRDLLKFTAFVALASFFHVTAFLFLVAYFFVKPISSRWIILILTASIILNYFNLLGMLMEKALTGNALLIFKLQHYIESQENRTVLSFLLGLTKKLILLFFLIRYRAALEKNFSNFTLIFNFYLFSLFIFFTFNYSFQIIVSRGMLYFSIFEVLLLPSFMLLIKKRREKQLYVLFLGVFGLLTLYKSISVYSDLFFPYKGIWINENFVRNLY